MWSMEFKLSEFKVSVICGNIGIVRFLKLMNSLDIMFQRNSRTCALLPFCVVLGNQIFNMGICDPL